MYLAVTLSLMAGTPAEKPKIASGPGGIQTQDQFDNWVMQAEQDLQDGARKGNIKAGDDTTTSIEVCIDNELADIVFEIIGTGNGNSRAVKTQTYPTGTSCPPSTDLNFGDLSNPNTVQQIEYGVVNLVKFIQGRDRTPVAHATTPSTTFTLFPLYRDAAFVPVFPANSSLTSPGCSTSDGAKLLEVNHGSSTVTLIASCGGQVIKSIPVGSNPLQVAVSPDSSFAIVTSFDNFINFIDLTSNSVVNTIQTTGTINPSGVAISPDGTTAYVTSFSGMGFGTAALLTINIAQHSVVRQLAMPDFPQSVFLTPDGALAYVMCSLSNQIAVVDTLSGTLVNTMSMPKPFAVAFDRTGTRAFITSGGNPGNVIVWDTATYQKLASIPMSNEPVDIKFSPEDGVLIDKYLN